MPSRPDHADPADACDLSRRISHVDAITVTANNGADLQRLLTCERVRESFDRLIVVDNHSSDGSPEMARDAGATVISLQRREGYGHCVNVGVELSTGSRFAVLNPDIWFDDDDVIQQLQNQLDLPGVALAAPALVLPDGRLQDSARHFPTPLDLVLRRALGLELGAIRVSGEVPWVVGACFIARRDAWESIGGFDERYFLYFEDVDLCWRLREAGWTVRLDGDVQVQHRHGGASRRSVLGWATRQHLASAARFYRANPRSLLSRRLPEPTRWHGPLVGERE